MINWVNAQISLLLCALFVYKSRLLYYVDAEFMKQGEVMRSKTYEINLKPIPWQRAGLNNNYFFDRQQEEKVAFGLILNKQHGIEPIFTGPLCLEALFYLEQPKTKAQRLAGPYHFKRPDLDNYLKFILDTITDTKAIWNDDNQVAWITAKKLYAKNAKTVITITEL